MRNFTIYIVVVFFVFSMPSCSQDDQCTPSFISITSLENEYGCVNTLYQMDINLSDDFMIIRSQPVFNDRVTGDCTPDINFDVYDLIIGKKMLTNGFESITYDGIIKHCENSQLDLTVTFVLNMTAEAPDVTYHALVPKLEIDERINVSVVVL